MNWFRRTWWRFWAAVLPVSVMVKLLPGPTVIPALDPSPELVERRQRRYSGSYEIPETDRRYRRVD